MKSRAATVIDRFFIKNPRLRRIVTRLVYGDRDVDVEILGNSVRINTALENGYFRFARMAWKYEFLRSELRPLMLMASLVERGCTFVDVGANVGIWSIMMASMAELGARPSIFAFEPDPLTFKRLKINALRYGFRAVNCALGATCGVISMRRGAVSHVAHFADRYSPYTQGLAETFEAVCARLDCFQFEKISPSIMLMKIDVEGAEMEVVKGAEVTLRNVRRAAMYIDGYSHPELPKHIEKMGFEMVRSKWFVESGRIFAVKNVSH